MEATPYPVQRSELIRRKRQLRLPSTDSSEDDGIRKLSAPLRNTRDNTIEVMNSFKFSAAVEQEHVQRGKYIPEAAQRGLDGEEAVEEK
jgi:hypothetical protein